MPLLTIRFLGNVVHQRGLQQSVSIDRFNVLGKLVHRNVVHVVFVQRRAQRVRIVNARNLVVSCLQPNKILFRPDVLAAVLDGVHQFACVITMLAASHFDHVAGWIMVAGTFQGQRAEEGHQLLGASLVNALSIGQRVQLIEHLEKTGGRLVDGADDGSTAAR